MNINFSTCCSVFRSLAAYTAVVKGEGQAHVFTEFGAGSGVQVASLGSSPTPTNLPAPQAIFLIFFDYFHIFWNIIFVEGQDAPGHATF